MAVLNGNSRGRILVVGAGFGGLAAAVELHRNGFHVDVIESVQQLTTQGQYCNPRTRVEFGLDASTILRTISMIVFTH